MIIIGTHPHRKQIRLAKKLKMPIIIHNREATTDVLDILEEEGAKEVGGIMHCYSDSPEHINRILAMDFYISLGGPVTFKNAKLPKEVAKEVPLDRLLLEPDAPYLAPHPHRGKRNEPALMTHVAKEIASIKGISYEKLAQQTTENAFRIYKIRNKTAGL